MTKRKVLVKSTLLLLVSILLSQCRFFRRVDDLREPLHPEFLCPVFPLPPPVPSAMEDLSDQFLNIVSKLKDIDEILISALETNGYSRKSYFYVPNGFALVTQLEHIDKDGYSIPEPNRWTFERTEHRSKDFTIVDYIYSLFKAKPGYYRCIVFLITNEVYSLRDHIVTKEEADIWLRDGFIKLPSIKGEIKFTDDYKVMALIYEFKKLENEDEATLITTSSHSGKIHLSNAGILNSLTK